MSLTKERDTQAREVNFLPAPLAADVKVYAGGLGALDASGNLTPGAAATTLKKSGRIRATVDNTGGSAGAVSGDIELGCFRWDNSTSTDAITRADIGSNCYIVDDQTVAKTNGTNTRSVAGQIIDVDAGGVWVRHF